MSVFNHKVSRAISRFRPAHAVFGPSALDRALGDYRKAAGGVPAFDWPLSEARTALGRANRVRPEYRRDRRADAFRAINSLRAQRRIAIARSDAAAAAYASLGGDPAIYARELAAWLARPAPVMGDGE